VIREELLQWLMAQLVAMGPWLLFIVCLLETAIFAGLILPVGALIAFGAMLSSRGVLDPTQIVTAAFFGALFGDQLGFLVGRWFVFGARPARSRVARVWRTALAQTERLVRQRRLLGVTVARAVPFVRTLMPWFSGRSGIPWGRFFVFDFLGVLLWGTIYIGGGFVAGVGWSRVAGRYGEIAGAVVLILALLVSALVARGWIRGALRRRFERRSPRRSRRRSRPRSHAGPRTAAAPEEDAVP
jgi:membrane-associated protein